MKTALMTLALMTASSSAFAGTGMGSLSCNSDDRIVALYSYFNSQADSYSGLDVFVKDKNGDFKQYSAVNQEALHPLTVITAEGQEISVAPNLREGICSILEK